VGKDGAKGVVRLHYLIVVAPVGDAGAVASRAHVLAVPGAALRHLILLRLNLLFGRLGKLLKQPLDVLGYWLVVLYAFVVHWNGLVGSNPRVI
jgi:hypothetical protein